MEMYVKCQDDSSNQHVLQLEKKIGKGKFSVYLVFSISHNTYYALKTFPATSFGAEQYRKELLSSTLCHRNIIQHIPLRCASTDFYGFATELAKYGDLLNLITKRGPLGNETFVRTYFHQLIEGLEYIHSQGIAHLDLKLENLVLGKRFVLKIIDFDQAQSTSDDHITSAGTPNYRPPEVILGECKNLIAVDIYSAGIILFSLRTGQFPFMEKVKPQGIHLCLYSLFLRHNSKFWKDKAACLKEEEKFSTDFIGLMNGMLECDAEKRFTIQQIKDSKWYQGPILSEENLRAEMKPLFQKSSMEQREKGD